MRELEVLLSQYLERHFPSASVADRNAFERILELQDPQIFGYLLGGDLPAEVSLRNVVARIRRADP